MRIITHTITFIFILAFFTRLSAQEEHSGTHEVPTPAIESTPISAASQDSCRALQTIWNGGNSNDGIMVNIQTFSWVTIEKFSVYINSFDSGYVKIYYIADSAKGHEKTPADWTFIDSAFVTGTGTTTPVMIPIDVDVTMPAWSLYSFYITGTGTPNIIYSNGAGTSYDSTLTLWPGAGLAYPFGMPGDTAYQDRVFNGIVHYCEAPVSVSETQFSNEISVSPNPFDEYTSINFSTPMNEADVIVYNIIGKEVKRVNADNAASVRLSREGLSAGIYFVNVVSGGRAVAVKKIVVN